jgi:pimeloyl-ACP methyl ester carboxylesterase
MTANSYAPSPLDTLAEGPRLAFETMMHTMFSFPDFSAQTPNDQFNPVMCLPGFGVPESTMDPVRSFLTRKGHDTYHWDQGTNTGPKYIAIEDVAKRIRAISKQHDHKPVDLVGHSLGGVYAFGAAAYLQKNKIVGRIITMGSPVNNAVLDREKQGVEDTVAAIFNFLNDPKHPAVKKFMGVLAKAFQSKLPNIPVTCIYSRSDGIVGEAMAQTNIPCRLKENVEIAGSHSGLSMNASAHRIIADRLALPLPSSKRMPA